MHRRPGSWCSAAALLALLAASAPTPAAATVPAHAHTTQFHRYRVRLRTPSPEIVRGYTRLVKLCSWDVSGLLGEPEGRLPWIIVADNTEPTPGDDALTVRFDPQQTAAEAVHDLTTAFVARRAQALRHEGDPAATGVEWLVAGLVYGLVYCPRLGVNLPLVDYQPARALFARRQFPDVTALMQEPPPADAGPAYRLYALHCNLLMAAIARESEGRDRLRRLFSLQARGREAVAAASFVLNDVFRAGEDVQQWYEGAAQSVSRRGRRPMKVAAVTRAVAELVTVPVLTPATVGAGPTALPIEDVPQRVETLRDDPKALNDLQHRLFELGKDAPHLLQPAIQRFLAGIEALQIGRMFTFRRTMRRARRELGEAVLKQQALEELLDSYEGDTATVEQRFPLFLEVAERNRQRQRLLDPELHRLLDELER